MTDNQSTPQAASVLIVALAMILSMAPPATWAYVAFFTDSSTSDSVKRSDSSSTPDSETSDSSSSGGSDPVPTYTGPPPTIELTDVSGLKKLKRRFDHLLDRLDSGDVLSGVPDYELAADARTVSNAYAKWVKEDLGIVTVYREYARANEELAQSLASLAESPSQETLDEFNKDIRKSNRKLERVKEYQSG